MGTILIEQWDMDRAAELYAIWVESTADAPYYYAVGPEEFATGIIPVESDDESRATARSQILITASDAGRPVGFAHLCAAVMLKSRVRKSNAASSDSLHSHRIGERSAIYFSAIWRRSSNKRRA